MVRCREPTHAELVDEARTFAPFKRRRHLDPVACFLFATFVIVAAAYAFLRLRYSILPLQGLVWYGVLVFAIEILGAASIAFYGVWLIARPDNSDIAGPAAASAASAAGDEAHEEGGSEGVRAVAAKLGVPLRRGYHVRVLVPCYTEPLAIVQARLQPLFALTSCMRHTATHDT